MIKGIVYIKNTSQSFEAIFEKYKSNEIKITYDNNDYIFNKNDINVSNRLANTKRKIILANDDVFFTSANDDIDKIFKRNNLFLFENNMKIVFVALIVSILSLGSFIKWGIPYISHNIAHALPHKTNTIISKDSLKFMNKYMFNESNISKMKQRKLNTIFIDLIKSVNKNNNIKYKLHFKSWEINSHQIPNALALPSGDIIITDELIKLSKNNNEIKSILLHEIGHVEHRHSLEMLVQSTLLSFTVLMISPDSSILTDMGIGLGTILISSSYSKKHETQADIYSFKNMLKLKIDPIEFSNIMARLNKYYNKNKKETSSNKNDYFSSHPNTMKRINLAKKYSNCYKQSIINCN